MEYNHEYLIVKGVYDEKSFQIKTEELIQIEDIKELGISQFNIPKEKIENFDLKFYDIENKEHILSAPEELLLNSQKISLEGSLIEIFFNFNPLKEKMNEKKAHDNLLKEIGEIKQNNNMLILENKKLMDINNKTIGENKMYEEQIEKYKQKIEEYEKINNNCKVYEDQLEIFKEQIEELKKNLTLQNEEKLKKLIQEKSLEIELKSNKINKNEKKILNKVLESILNKDDKDINHNYVFYEEKYLCKVCNKEIKDMYFEFINVCNYYLCDYCLNEFLKEFATLTTVKKIQITEDNLEKIVKNKNVETQKIKKNNIKYNKNEIEKIHSELLNFIKDFIFNNNKPNADDRAKIFSYLDLLIKNNSNGYTFVDDFIDKEVIPKLKKNKGNTYENDNVFLKYKILDAFVNDHYNGYCEKDDSEDHLCRKSNYNKLLEYIKEEHKEKMRIHIDKKLMKAIKISKGNVKNVFEYLEKTL